MLKNKYGCQMHRTYTYSLLISKPTGLLDLFAMPGNKLSAMTEVIIHMFSSLEIAPRQYIKCYVITVNALEIVFFFYRSK